ncbi:MAG TPA: 1-acyl-sn-glycerol-3-phosphate acyltransferase [Rhodanobacteraceae bacterium]
MPVATTREATPWLPHPGVDAHPRGSWLLALGFDLWISAFYRRTVVVPPDFHIAPGTLIASNHQRDVDGPMLGTVLVRRRALHFEWPLPFFATREDLFRSGILARLTVRWPRPVSALLGRVSLAWFFPLGHAEPMRRIREFTLGETLRALVDAGYGDADCATLLNARGRRATGITPGALSVRAAVARRDLPLEGWWGLRKITCAALAQLAPTFRATIDAQLAHFARRLDAGSCVYFAPEGTISRNGRFGRIRAGFFRLARMARVAPWIQPMALTYDVLGPGRPRVVVRIGDAFHADAGLERGAFDAMLKQAVTALAAVTPSHLLARFLLHGPATFTQDQLAGWIAQALATLRDNQRPLDPLFAHVRLAALVRNRVRWLERQRLVVRAGGHFRNVCPRDAAPCWHTRAGIARYLDNNLGDLVHDTAQTLPC